MSDGHARTHLVTGASGFIASHLVRRLSGLGERVHVVLRESSSAARVAGLPGVVVHRHDGSTDDLLRIVSEAAPATVYHLASRFVARHSVADVSAIVRSNVEFATQLAEAMVAAGVSHLVNTGTSWQHFEDADYGAVCLYAASKQAAEAMLDYYVAVSPLRVITLKLFDTYGPDDPRPKLFAMLRRLAQNPHPTAMSPGDQLIDVVYIDDVVDAFVGAADRLRAGAVSGHERYSVSSGAPIPLRELARRFGAAAGIELPLQWGALPHRPREVMVPWTRGEPLPGWSPRVGLEEGISRLLASP